MLQVAFQSHLPFARILKNVGDAFSKSSSIYYNYKGIKWERAQILQIYIDKKYD